MAEHQVDTEIGSAKESKILEVVFKTLWDKVKRAAELIEQFREENKNLKANIENLEAQVSSLQKELNQKEETLREIKEQSIQEMSRNNSLLTEEEKEAFKARIKDLVVKINSHL